MHHPFRVAGTNKAGTGSWWLSTNRNKESLEEFPLDALKLVGMVTYEGRLYAMVKAPDGVIHRAGIGNHMGQNFGTITKISASPPMLMLDLPTTIF